MNHVKTAMLLAGLTALFLWAGHALGGLVGLVVALGLTALMNLVAWFHSDKLILALHGARPVGDREAPELMALVRELAGRAGLPMPRVFVLPDETPNAFAVGRNPRHAAVAVTRGLVERMERRELAGVIGHELGHIRNRDTLIMMVAATLAGAVSLLADIAFWGAMFGGAGRHDDDDSASPLGGLLGVLFAPFAALLIQMAISRSREYVADEQGAHIAGDPLALASALRKLGVAAAANPMRHGTPGTAHLFIVNPLRAGGLATLFSTHPPIEERIRRLEEMALREQATSAR